MTGMEDRREGARRGFIGIISGSALAQILAIAAIPLLARLYTPEDTAYFALMMGIGTVAASFASLRLELAIPLPEDVLVSRQLFWVSIIATAGVMPVTAVVAIVTVWAFSLGPLPLDPLDWILLSVFVFVLCLFQSASQLAIRIRAYSLLGRLPVIQMGGTVIAQIGLGLAGLGRGLFLGGVIGRSVGVIRFSKTCELHLDQIPSPAEVRRLLREYWRFPAIFAPAAAVEVLGSNVSALMLPALYGFSAAGLFAMATRVSALPATVLSQSAGQVFLGEFSRTNDLIEARRIFLRWSAILAGLGSAVALALWFLSPIVLPALLDDKWEGTDRLAQYTGLMAGAAMLGSPVQHVWTVRQRGFMQFSWCVLRLVVTAGVLLVGERNEASLPSVALALALSTCGVYAIAWVGCFYAAVRPGRA